MERKMKRQTVSKKIRDVLPKTCCNCGATENLVYHHIVPVSVGGKDIASNIAVVCPDCHGLIHRYDEIAKYGRGDLIKEGIAKAKAKGYKNGRKPADYENVMRLIAEHSTQFNDVNNPNYKPYTEHEIMEMGNVKEVCYNKCKRMLIEAMQADEWIYSWDKPTIHNNRPLYDRVIRKMRSEVNLFSYQEVGGMNG